MCTKSRFLATLLIASVTMTMLLPEGIFARPSGNVSRRKRVSDQRLAELETWFGLAKMKGVIITVPVAFGLVDPAKVGRRRRSVADESLSDVEEIVPVEKQRLLFLPRENDEILPLPAKIEREEAATKRGGPLSLYLISNEGATKDEVESGGIKN